VLLHSKNSKDFLRNTISQDWLSAFAMLSAEKVMTQEINFNDKVTDKPANCKKKREWTLHTNKIVYEIIYSMIQKDGLNFIRLYFLNYTWYVNDLHNI